MALVSGAREAAYREGARSAPGDGRGHTQAVQAPQPLSQEPERLHAGEGARSVPGDGRGNMRVTGPMQASQPLLQEKLHAGRVLRWYLVMAEAILK